MVAGLTAVSRVAMEETSTSGNRVAGEEAMVRGLTV